MSGTAGERRYFVYIMANKPWGTLYVGVSGAVRICPAIPSQWRGADARKRGRMRLESDTRVHACQMVACFGVGGSLGLVTVFLRPDAAQLKPIRAV